MLNLIIHLKSGEQFEFTTHEKIGRIVDQMNKNDFMYFGSIIFKTSEIYYIESK